MNKIDYLSKVELLAELNYQELKELAEEFEWQSFGPGAEIIRQGEEQHRFYVLVDGRAEAVIDKKGSKAPPLSVFESGDVFGEIALFTRMPSPVTVRTAQFTNVLVLEGEQFAHMLVRWPKLYHAFIEKVSHRFNQANFGLWEAKHKEFLRSGLRANQLKYKFYDLWGGSYSTRKAEERIRELAQTREHVLLIGESGTGQQMMAWHIHKAQLGENAPFIAMYGKELDQHWGDLALEAHAEGSHHYHGSGLLEMAEGGTLFIRDINLMSPQAQRKLASFLGSAEINCRIIGSLLAEPQQLNVPLLPDLEKHFTQTHKFSPLRDRKRDIPILAKGILERLAKMHNRKVPTMDTEATRLLLTHNYRQGNTSELIKIIERAFFLAEGDVIGTEQIFFGPTAERTGGTFNLLSLGWVKEIIAKEIYPLWIQRLFFIGFIINLVILLWRPSPEATALALNLSWGVWWPTMIISTFLLGRFWCGICPFSYAMEVAQKLYHLNRPIPANMIKYDYLLITGLFALIIWTETVTDMRHNALYTGLLVFSIMAAAVLVGIYYTRHTWCHHLCPIGGLIGMASVASILEVRSDSEICLNKCSTQECYKGTKAVEGCPMFQLAPYLDCNVNCKLCMRCIRNCPNDALRFNLRVPGREIWYLLRMNQGFVVFIGVALAILPPLTYFEHYYQGSAENWQIWFSLIYLAFITVGGLLVWFMAQPYRTKGASTKVKAAFALIPLISAGYIAYHLKFFPGIEELLFGIAYPVASTGENYYFISAVTLSQWFWLGMGLIFTVVALSITLYKGRLRQKHSA